jgi:hypothetical protein
MKTLTALLMLVNAALFFFGAVQHAGIALGPFHEPYIIRATIVETLCGLGLLCGAVALLRDWKKSWSLALAGNLFALAGVLLGMVALAVGAGPRTASNDLYHRIMLVLIAAATLLLCFRRRFSTTM